MQQLGDTTTPVDWLQVRRHPDDTATARQQCWH